MTQGPISFIKKHWKYKDYTAKKEQHKDSTQKRKNRQSKDATGLSHLSNQIILFIKKHRTIEGLCT